MSQPAQKSQYNDLLPPDLYAEVTDQFRDNALEVGGETLEQTDAAREVTDDSKGKGGAAMFDGAPKPSPYDELGAAVYQRDPDASPAEPPATAEQQRGSFASMRAEQAATPAPAQTPAQEPETAPERQRGSFASMKAEQAASPAPQGNDDLMPPSIKAEVENEGRAGFQQAASQTTGQNDDLMPPDIRAGVEAEQSRTMQRKNAAGFSM
jgi:hypothetical protein